MKFNKNNQLLILTIQPKIPNYQAFSNLILRSNMEKDLGDNLKLIFLIILTMDLMKKVGECMSNSLNNYTKK